MVVTSNTQGASINRKLHATKFSTGIHLHVSYPLEIKNSTALTDNSNRITHQSSTALHRSANWKLETCYLKGEQLGQIT